MFLNPTPMLKMHAKFSTTSKKDQFTTFNSLFLIVFRLYLSLHWTRETEAWITPAIYSRQQNGNYRGGSIKTTITKSLLAFHLYDDETKDDEVKFKEDRINSLKSAKKFTDNDQTFISLTSTSHHLRSKQKVSRLSARREFFIDVVSKVCTGAALSSSVSLGGIFWQQPANALPDIVATTAICDPTVSAWQFNDRRIVYLLGTAHISQLSAELAGQLVRDTHPNAVFVELDIKRIGGLSRSMMQRQQQVQQQETLPTSEDEQTAETGGEIVPVSPPRPKVRIIIPDVTVALSTTAVEESPGSAVMDTPLLPPPPPPPRQQGFGFNLRQKAMNFASAAVGNALKGMYKNLDSAGFNPGEEFAAAILEGQKVGADIVLGDQDVEKTLRRLTEALAVTDFSKITSADAEFEKTMNELLPGGQGPPPPVVLNSDDPGKYKAELAEYIEKLKSRENVRKIMSQLNDVAPALVQAMVTERDAYMAAGIDLLNQYECIVAVMGIAHQDGVEKNLKDKGWKQIPLNTLCRRLRIN